jgi:hypothetical protein
MPVNTSVATHVESWLERSGVGFIQQPKRERIRWFVRWREAFPQLSGLTDGMVLCPSYDDVFHSDVQTGPRAEALYRATVARPFVVISDETPAYACTCEEMPELSLQPYPYGGPRRLILFDEKMAWSCVYCSVRTYREGLLFVARLPLQSE